MRPAIIRFLGILVLLHWPVLDSQRVDAQSAAQAIEPGIEAEALRHFQAILRFDTSNPPGNEVLVVDYLKSVLEKEGIETKIFARDPKRPNLVARLRGNGRGRPILIMGHTDVVTVDPTKWKFPPFSATRDGGYIYGRGTVDDKVSVAAGLMTMIQLKRRKIALDRDVIFLAEASEEGGGPNGIPFMVENHWAEIEAEFCYAEGGGVIRTGGKVQFATVASTEKIAHTIRLVARGVAGHGSVPLRSNAIVHLSQAIARIAAWRTPMRLNETTRTYFERMAALGSPAESAIFQKILSGKENEEALEYLAINQPRLYSTLHTSISPNIIKGGYLRNVIPSEAEATLDIRALPDEDIPALLTKLRAVIDDPAIEIEKILPNATRPAAAPSRLDSVAFSIIESAHRQIYDAATLPTMMTGGTDMAYLRARGVQCYGIGPLIDSEDGPRGFGAHSDQERILEESFNKFIRFQWMIVVNLAGSPPGVSR
jgi:acetylornithine deacetylase/succinyl-diaminopimelate desuccinylase-like protein